MSPLALILTSSIIAPLSIALVNWPRPPLADVNNVMLPALGMREPVSGLTHIIAAVIAGFGTSILWDRSKGDRPKQVSMLVYGLSLVILYCASSTYHVVDASPEALVLYRKFDHCAIFALIAGTYTPFCFNAASGRWRVLSLATIWGLAFAGIGLKSIWIDISDGVSASLYIVMGWLAIIGYTKLASVITHRGMMWCGVGGVIYSTGATIDVLGWPWSVPGVFGAHEVFHLCVMVASAVHYAVVLRYVVPVGRPGFALAGEAGEAEVTAAS